MACIGRIDRSLVMACGAPPNAFNRIQGAKLINAADIESYTVSSADGSATITRVPTSVGYDVTTVNNALTLSVGMKSQDIMPGAYDVSITFKVFSANFSSGFISDTVPGGVVNRVARAELVIAVDHGGGVYRVYGLGAPLVCLEHVLDSTEDGYVTLTYGVEDWQVGTTIHALSREAYEGLSTPAPAPTPKPSTKEKEK